jgi:hypothetical protein
MSFIYSPIFIAFPAFLTHFICHWLRFDCARSQNCKLFLPALTSLCAFWSLALLGATHYFDPSAPLSCSGTSGNGVDFSPNSLSAHIESILGRDSVSVLSRQLRWLVIWGKPGGNSLLSD